MGFFQDMSARGFGDSPLNVSDGAGGIIKAIGNLLPALGCPAHHKRNLVAKMLEDIWPEFKAPTTACYQAPSCAIARDLAERSAPRTFSNDYSSRNAVSTLTRTAIVPHRCSIRLIHFDLSRGNEATAH